MKKLIFSLVFLAVLHPALAQTLSPTVVKHPGIFYDRLSGVDSLLKDYTQKNWLAGAVVLIVKENQFCTVLISFQEKMASPAFIQALEDCVLFIISQENFLRFVSQSDNAKKIYTTILNNFRIIKSEDWNF